MTKTFTATIVLQLVEEGKLRLESTLEDHVPGVVPRGDEITVRQLLEHRSGLANVTEFPAWMKQAERSSSTRPLGTLRFAGSRPLEFDPGSRFRYSNTNYIALGLVIEKVSGKPYEQYVKEEVFAPLSITAPRIGKSLASERADGEVKYYVVNDGTGVAVTGPAGGNEGEKVPVSYGVWRQETLDAHGGWIASTIDLAKFGAALDVIDGGQATRGKLLSPASVKEILSPHADIKPPGDDTKTAPRKLWHRSPGSAG